MRTIQKFSKSKLAAFAAMLLLVGLFFVSTKPAATLNGPATVQTDKLDYHPGEIAVITGSDFSPGETVVL